jgi:hypothetical protein
MRKSISAISLLLSLLLCSVAQAQIWTPLRVLNSGTLLPLEYKLNFVNGGCVNNAGASRIDCTFSTSSIVGLNGAYASAASSTDNVILTTTALGPAVVRAPTKTGAVQSIFQIQDANGAPIANFTDQLGSSTTGAIQFTSPGNRNPYLFDTSFDFGNTGTLYHVKFMDVGTNIFVLAAIPGLTEFDFYDDKTGLGHGTIYYQNPIQLAGTGYGTLLSYGPDDGNVQYAIGAGSAKTTPSGHLISFITNGLGTPAEQAYIRNDGQLGAPHHLGMGSAPSCVLGAAAGTGGSPTCTVTGNDTEFTIVILSGTVAGSGTLWATVTYALVFPTDSSASCVAQNSTTQTAFASAVYATSAASFTINAAASAAQVTYTFKCGVLGR